MLPEQLKNLKGSFPFVGQRFHGLGLLAAGEDYNAVDVVEVFQTRE